MPIWPFMSLWYPQRIKCHWPLQRQLMANLHACMLSQPMSLRLKYYPKFSDLYVGIQGVYNNALNYKWSLPYDQQKQFLKQTVSARLRSSSSHHLAVLHVRLSTVGKRVFSVSSTTVWNDLPPHVTSASSLTIFRQRLKSFLFSQSYSDIHAWLT